MSMRFATVIGAAVVVSACPGIAGGASITSGNATLDLLHAPPGLVVFSGNLGNGSLVTDAGAPDQLYMLNWYYRTEFDSVNRPFSSLDTPAVSVVGDTMTVTYTNAGPGPSGQNRFNATIELTIEDFAEPGVLEVRQEVTFTASPSNSGTRVFRVFHITDLDLIGSGSGDGFDDEIGLTAPDSRVATQTDAAANIATMDGTDADVAEVNTGFALRNRMSTPFGDFTQTWAPIGGDAAVGFRWTLTLAPGESRVLASSFFVGSAPAPRCAGDVNGDGRTDSQDFTVLAGNFGTSVPHGTMGDLNDDGLVNAADFGVLAGDFGCE
jgi:hypothetical protein